jgi:RNA polymerase sigma-70 factor (ECF subfamily)
VRRRTENVYLLEEAGVDREPTSGDSDERMAQFVDLLTLHQRKLYGYIATMLLGDSTAADVLQETNHDLWAKMGEYDFERSFLSWAFGFARQRVLAHRRSFSRSRLIFGEEAMKIVEEACMEFAAEADDRVAALEKCLQKLSSQEAALVRERYTAKLPVKEIAERMKEPVQNISSRLHRIRKRLADCIRTTLSAERM